MEKTTVNISGEKFGSAFAKEKIVEKTESFNYDHLFDGYDGDMTNLVKIVAKDELLNAGWNKNYFHKITNTPTICVHPNQKEIPGGERFVRIIFGEKKFVVTLLKTYFTYKEPESDYNFGLEGNMEILTENESERIGYITESND